jgi:gas vesicle protein
MKAMRRATVWAVVWLLAGLGIGIVTTLLYAPAAGKKTRRNLSKKVEKGFDNSQDAIEPVVKRLEKEVGELRETMEERIAKLR